MTTAYIRKSMPRKPPVKRAFSGVVGLPPEPEIVADPANPVPAIEPEVPKSAIKNRPPKSAPIAKQSFRTPRHWIPDIPGPYCLRHAKKRPCSGCNEIPYEETKWTESVEQHVGGDLFDKWTASITPVFHGKWVESAKKAKLRIPAVTITNPNYDPEQFRREIDMGLIYARKVLKDFPSYMTFEDLKQIAELEVWIASQHYAKNMNGAIAYTIAKYQGRRFLRNQIKEQTITVENPNGSSALDESGQPMRIQKFLSFDDKEEDGEPREIGVVEEEASLKRDGYTRIKKNGQSIFVPDNKAWISDVQRKLPLLEALVQTWHGAKRAVGEALLKDPNTALRDIPGVPRSTAARVRQAVLIEFRKIMDSQSIERNDVTK